ncbi:hypothetical protein KSS87_013240 [Heliosperma pusillum]|nr:hypothetical protein KSS87_013240 [Heliosperma pusillum]
MAESDKPDPSATKAKSKSSFLDEDLSDDFLSSWKSNSVTGGDDMDFNFEPVAKGKNKAFDFGMDMDFSLDDAFGKMPSFKFDMPDIDFSISPKKSPKSKENNSEGESTEGSRQEKNAKSDFSFDFNKEGDDNEKGENRTKVIADAVPHGGQTKDGLHFLDKGKMSIDIKSSGVDSNSEGNGQILHVNPSSQGRELIEQGSAVEKKEKNADVSRDGDNNENGEIRTKMVAGSLPSDGQEEKDEPHLLNNRKMIVDIKPSRSKEIAFIEVFGNIPSLKLNKPNSDCCGSSKKPSKFNESLSEEESAKGNCHEKIDKLSSPPHLKVKLDAAPVSEKEKVVGAVETLDNENFTLTSAASSATNFKSMNFEVASSSEIQKSGFEDSPAPPDRLYAFLVLFYVPCNMRTLPSSVLPLPLVPRFKNNLHSGEEFTLCSKPTQAHPKSTQYQVSGAHNFSMARGTADGIGMKLTIAESKKTGLTPVGASDSGDDPSHERDVEEFGDSPSSCAKEILKQDSVVEEREKNADISRDVDNNANEEIRTNTAVQLVQHDGEAEKDGLHLLDNKKMSTNDNCSGIRLPSLVPSKGISKSSNQGYELRGKISGTSTVQENRLSFTKMMPSLPSLRMPTLPSLRISRNTTPNKQSSSLAMKEPNAMRNLEKSPSVQVKSKMVSPVNVQKQTPSMPSLKRKPSEAADLHPSKRLSSSESRKSEESVREAVNNVTSSTYSEVQPQGTMLEGSEKNVTAENLSHEFDFRLETSMENLGFTLMESDVNVEKAEACAKELDEICTMLKKKHDEAKELLVRALVNNNNLLMLNHPICEEKISFHISISTLLVIFYSGFCN